MAFNRHPIVWFCEHFILCSVLTLCVLCGTARAQTDGLQDLGVPTFSVADQLPGGIGFVNVSNGNLHIEIPLASFPQRGMGGRPLVAKMIYDSHLWVAESGTNGSFWNPCCVLAGWRIVTDFDPGFATVNNIAFNECQNNTVSDFIYTSFEWVESNGTYHQFPIRVSTNHGCGNQQVLTGDALATDSSGLHMYVTVTPTSGTSFDVINAKVYFRDGSSIQVPVQSSSEIGLAEDANGNSVQAQASQCVLANISSGGFPIDTLGRQPFSASFPSNCSITTPPSSLGLLNSEGFVSTYTPTWPLTHFQTNFQISGITEASGFIQPLGNLSLPDGTSYKFTYDCDSSSGVSACNSPSGQSAYYGLLTSITLPTGGVIRFTYANFTDANGNTNRWVSTRTDSDMSTFVNYSYVPATGCGTGCQTVTVTRPIGDKSCGIGCLVSADQQVYTFVLNQGNGSWNTNVKYYSGQASSGTLLATVTTSYSSFPIAPILGSGGFGFVQPTNTTVTVPSTSGVSLVKQTTYQYDSYSYSFNGSTWTGSKGKVLQKSEYAYGSGSTGGLLRTTSFSYLDDTSSAYANFTGRLTDVQVKDSSGNLKSETKTSYDSTSLSGISGIIHHDDANYGVSNTIRGNPTLVQRCASVTTTCSSFVNTTKAYDTTGQLISVQDSALNTTTLGYADSFFTDNGANPPQAFTGSGPTNAYLTSVTRPLIGTTAFGYYFSSGKMASSQDPNGANTFTHFLDSLDRLTNAYGPIAPSGNRPWTLLTYGASDTDIDSFIGITDAAPSSGCSSCAHGQAVLNDLGRTISSILVNDPDGATTTSTQYDNAGRVFSVTNPYRSTSDPTYGTETPGYDGLNRVIVETHADGDTAHTYYGASVTSGGGVASQLCAAGTYGLGYPMLIVDESGRKRQKWTDALGRDIELDEQDNSGNLTLNTCYSYNALNKPTQVAQGGQTRAYNYDPLARLTSAATPETNQVQVTYSYNSAGGTCSGNLSLPCSRTDARAILTTYTYDGANRVTGVSYANDPNSTPSVHYGYDGNAPSGCTTAPPTLTILNPKGRRTSMCDGSGATSWSYDASGNLLTEKRTIAGLTKTSVYTYNLDGSLASITYATGKKVNYQVGNARRMLAATDSNGTEYASAAQYAPMGAASSIVYGKTSTFTGVTETNGFNNRLELTSTAATSTAGTALNLSFCYGTFSFSGGCSNPSTNNSGNVTGITNNSSSALSVSFTYDSLNRSLSGATNSNSATGCWGQSFGPNGAPPPGPPDDRYSNLSEINVTECTAGSLNISVSTTTNQVNSSGFQYDSAGNMTNDALHTFTYDAENRIIAAGGMSGGPYCYVYDGNGLRVEKFHANGGTCASPTNKVVDFLYWRAPGGDTLETTNVSGTSPNNYVFFAGRRIARVNGAGTILYYHVDQLGSTVAISQSTSTTNGVVCYQAEFTPYGEEHDAIANKCAQNFKFAGYERDSETGLDYAFARYYSSRLGRFMSPDPLGGHSADPQSLNRYAYVTNNAVNKVDPQGLDDQGPDAILFLAYTSTYTADSAAESISFGGFSFDFGGFSFGFGDFGAGVGSAPPGIGLAEELLLLNSLLNLLPAQPAAFSPPTMASTLISSGAYRTGETGSIAFQSAEGASIASQTAEAGGCGSTGNPCIDSFAQAVFSQVYQQTGGLESGKFYAEWYGASALVGATGFGVAAYGRAVYEAGTDFILDAYNASINTYAATMARLIEWQVGDIEGFQDALAWILGALGGPPEATWGGLEGELTHCLLHARECVSELGIPVK